MRFPLISVRSLATIVAVTAISTMFFSIPRTPQARADSELSVTKGGLPLYFVENTGQVDQQVAYYLKGRDKTVYFTSRGLTFALDSGGRTGTKARSWAPRLDFVGSRPDARPEGRGQTPAVFNFLKGSRKEWRAGIRTYAGLIYHELWPGIDLIYEGTESRLKYQFVVRPGADPSRIKLAYRGVSGVEIDQAGRLAVSTPDGDFHDDRPVSFQEEDGRRSSVATDYLLQGRAGEAKVYGFRVGEYDHARPLIIDPAMLIYAGYLGGGGEDIGHSIAVDRAGNVYVTGQTTSDGMSFPGGDGFGALPGFDSSQNGKNDAFVAKINSAGTGLLYCTYIGGAGDDYGLGVAVDDFGSAYVTGETASPQTTFPVTRGPDLTFNGGLYDAFVAKLNPSGTALDYCGYIGGSNDDRGYAVAVDRAGNAYVSGTTISPQGTFPVRVGPTLVYSGDNDAFVAKVNAEGTDLIYSGYIGGFGNDFATGIAVDEAGNAYVSGQTTSETNFPLVVGPDQSYNGGIGDAFVAKVNPAGSGLVYCGYVGGTGYDLSFGIDVDREGNAYLTGATTSDESTFPDGYGIGALPASFSFFSGVADAYVVKVNAAGTGFLYAGFIGGNQAETGFGIAVDGEGRAHVVGTTASDGASFPLLGGLSNSFGGMSAAFVAGVNAAGTGLVYAGYVGGGGLVEGFDIAVNQFGDAYITGLTGSAATTFPGNEGLDLTYNGGPNDVFVAKLSTSRQVPQTNAPRRPVRGATR